MGQQEVSTSDNTTIKVTQLPRLAPDGENWLTYHKWVLNATTVCGLHYHLIGTVLKPSLVIEKDGNFYLSADDLLPLDRTLWTNMRPLLIPGNRRRHRSAS